MLKQLSLASVIASSAFLLPVQGSASPLSGIRQDAPTNATPVQYWDRGRCRGWRRECAERWGWRTERFHRCLARHGCERHRYDD